MSRFRSLTSRLVVTTVVLVAVVSVLIGTATTLAMRSNLTDQLDHDILTSIQLAADGPPPGARPGDGDREFFAGRNQAPGTLNAFLGQDTRQGTVLTGDRDADQTLSDDALADLDDVPVDGEVHEVDVTDAGNYRVVAVDATMVDPSGTDETGTLVSGLPTSDVDETVSSLIWVELLLGLLGVLVGGAAATVIVRRQLRPLREVAATAHTVAELPLAEGEIDLTERVPDHLTDEQTEVGQVGAALNTLLAHVETSLDARHRSELQVRQFVADASHELRTPLSTITGYAELARRRPDDTEAARTALAKVDEESGRMTRLVEDLLLLARLDSGRPIEHGRVDLTRLLVEAVSDARVVAPDHRWRLELPDDIVEVPGDEQRLHQVVTNLLTNARKHTPPRTTVTVAARADGFDVRDDGQGFPPDLTAHAFERFTRGDGARTRNPESGAGLGLALVQAIVSAHGGSVSLTSHPGDTVVSVHLPR
jgi:two-component system OmpR family sensor kinase